MAFVDPIDFAGELLQENQAFGELIAATDPDTQVPTCPGWTVSQLFRHMGRGDRWAAQMIIDRATAGLDPREVPQGRPPEGAELQWLHDGARRLTDAAAEAGDTEIWTFVGPHPASWWVRRRLHETVVHRADAAIAAGAPFTVAPVIAADAISEWLDLAAGRGVIPESTVHLHATDDGLGSAGEWTIGGGRWSHDHAKGDVALRGGATELLLALTGRKALGETSLELFGDPGVWQTCLAATAL